MDKMEMTLSIHQDGTVLIGVMPVVASEMAFTFLTRYESIILSIKSILYFIELDRTLNICLICCSGLSSGPGNS